MRHGRSPEAQSLASVPGVSRELYLANIRRWEVEVRPYAALAAAHAFGRKVVKASIEPRAM